MSKHTPWDELEAEKASIHYVKNQYGESYFLSGLEYESFRAGVKWAASQIEKCETIHGGENNMGTLSWSPSKMKDDTHIAKLVGVREVEK